MTMEDSDNIFGNHPEFADKADFVTCPASPDDLFSIFQSLDAELAQLDASYHTPDVASLAGSVSAGADQKSSLSHVSHESEPEDDQAECNATGWTTSPNKKRLRADAESSDVEKEDGQHRMSHITVERNRRKQMNEHLSVLRSLMPCFYVKRGDQASIIGGVVDYITELQQILQSLEAKKQRKVVYTETVMSSPHPTPSPRPSPLSPMSKPPLSPRVNLPISPRTPQPTNPYRPKMMQPQVSSGSCYSNVVSSPSPTSSTCSSISENLNELAANSHSSLADVEVKFSGANLLLLKTVSPRIPGQITKIVSVLEELSLETLQVNINSFDETTVNTFTIKIGIECQFSAEEVAHQIQQTFH